MVETRGVEADRPQPPDPSAEELRDRLLELRSHAWRVEAAAGTVIAGVHPAWRPSAGNLLHYLAVRQQDLRPLQNPLSRLGLSSLGRLEAHVLATLEAVIARLDDLLGPREHEDGPTAVVSHDEGDELLVRHTVEALGAERPGRYVRIMVTMPDQAASSPDLVERLLDAGMDLARVNGAHDTPDAWRRMIAHVRAGASAGGRPCPVAFDVAGPKLRTGPTGDAPQVLRVRPGRDSTGGVVVPARMRLVAGEVGALLDDGTAVVPVDGDLRAVQEGDRLRLNDARGRRRRLTVRSCDDDGCEATGDRTSYLVPGTEIVVERQDAMVTQLTVGELPTPSPRLDLRAGELLELVASEEPGAPARVGADGTVAPARIGCTLPEVIPQVRVGERILFDDGAITGVVRSTAADRVLVEVLRPAHAPLKSEKGINLPDTEIDIPALTQEDEAALTEVAGLVDLVALSFVQRPADVAQVLDVLDRLGASDVGVVLKIETRRAFEALPLLLLEAMRHRVVAVMVARGDLAVEVGFERLAEVQEEILWICEAAHVPVIWATQVLETLAKSGRPTRAEITDAASGSRAECVMLNKGPFVVDAVHVLDDVLRRMEAHQDKRTGLLRRLRVSEALGSLLDTRP